MKGFYSAQNTPAFETRIVRLNSKLVAKIMKLQNQSGEDMKELHTDLRTESATTSGRGLWLSAAFGRDRACRLSEHRNEKASVGLFRNVTISDVTTETPNRPQSAMNKFPTAWRHRCATLVTASITGLPENPVRNVTLKNISIVYGGIGITPKTTAPRLEKLDAIPEQAEHYPESTMFGVLPTWGFYCRHAEGVNFENVTLRVMAKDYRPALVCDDVKNLLLDGFHVLSAGKETVIFLKDVQGAAIRNSPAPSGTASFIKTSGNTSDINKP